MKKFVVLFFSCILFVLSACSVKHSQDIFFDWKNFVLETDGQIYKKIASEELPDFYLWWNIKDSYIEVGLQWTWIQPNFLSSFIFVQHNLSNFVDLKEFYDVNWEELYKYFENIESDWVKNGSFFCGSKQISSLFQDFDFYVSSSDKTFYVSQYFYVENNIGTIISFVSDDKIERKNFSYSLKSWKCWNK